MYDISISVNTKKLTPPSPYHDLQYHKSRPYQIYLFIRITMHAMFFPFRTILDKRKNNNTNINNTGEGSKFFVSELGKLSPRKNQKKPGT